MFFSSGSMKSTRESAGYAGTLMTKHAKTRLAGNSPMATSSRSITMTTSTWTSRLTCCPTSGDISSFTCAPMTTYRRPSLRTAWISTHWPSRASEADTHLIPPSNTNCCSRSRMESRVHSACYSGNGLEVYKFYNSLYCGILSVDAAVQWLKYSQ